MTGLADFFGWDALTAADNYMLNAGVQFALNIEPGDELCSRTVERYQALYQEDEAAQKVFFAVTAQLVELLDQDVSKQRLDSTHVCSHMATFGRIKLMAVTLKRALTQIKRHERVLYDALPAELRSRYEPTQDGQGPTIGVASSRRVDRSVRRALRPACRNRIDEQRSEEPPRNGLPAGTRPRRGLPRDDEQGDWLERLASGEYGRVARLGECGSEKAAGSGLVGELWAIWGCPPVVTPSVESPPVVIDDDLPPQPAPRRLNSNRQPPQRRCSVGDVFLG